MVGLVAKAPHAGTVEDVALRVNVLPRLRGEGLEGEEQQQAHQQPLTRSRILPHSYIGKEQDGKITNDSP